MRSVVVGLGVIGSLHKSLLEKNGYDLAAVCDIDAKKLKNAGVECFTDYFTALDTVKPDVVHICTPHYLHADMVVEALKRNINVLCEKPLCIKYEDIARILDAESKSSAKLGVCFQNRYNEEIRFVKNYLADKRVLSGFASVAWHRDNNYYRQDFWRGKKATEGGGVLINQAVHTVDLMQWFCGFPAEVVATVSTDLNEIEVEDTASVICGKGGEFVLFATNCAKEDLPVNIVLKTKDEIITVLRNKVVINDEIYSFEKKDPFGKTCYGTGHLPLINDFYDCLKSGRKFGIDGAEGAKAVKLVLAAYKSNGKKVSVDEK